MGRFKDTKDPEIKIRDGIYYYKGTPKRGAEDIQRSLGVKSFNEAKEAKRKLIESISGLNLSATRVSFNQYFDVEFLPERKKWAKRTFESAFYSIEAMRPFFGRYLISQLSDDLWGQYLAWNSTRIDGRDPERTLSFDRRHMMMIAKRLHRAGIIKVLPYLDIDSDRSEMESEGDAESDSKKRRVLSVDEIRRLRESTENFFYGQSAETYKGLILVLYKMGLRPGEALNLSWDRVDLDRNIMRLRAKDTKTRTAREMIMPPDVVTWLREWRLINPSPWVFPSRIGKSSKPLGRINKPWDKLCGWANVPKPNVPYCLRHTFLTECAKKIRLGQLSLAVVAKYAGTSTEMIEKHYLHIEGEDTRGVSELIDSIV